MYNISQNEKLSSIVIAVDSKIAEDIRIIEIGDLTIVADYFVIANGTSTTHTKTLAEEVEYQLSQNGVEPNRTEGYNGSSWVILDYGDIVVHVFYKETRDHYNLERLWSDGKDIDVKQFLPDETQD